MQDMTPQEIFDYKLAWKPGYSVDVHSDLDVQCKDWCRKNLKRWEWSMDKYTYVYAHTFYFEKIQDANEFKQAFVDWIDKGKT